MNRYEIDEQQLTRLKGIAVAIRADNVQPEDLAQLGYSLEAVIGECENAPIAQDDEETYGKPSEEDDEPESDDGSEEEL